MFSIVLTIEVGCLPSSQRLCETEETDIHTHHAPINKSHSYISATDAPWGFTVLTKITLHEVGFMVTNNVNKNWKKLNKWTQNTNMSS